MQMFHALIKYPDSYFSFCDFAVSGILASLFQSILLSLSSNWSVSGSVHIYSTICFVVLGCFFKYFCMWFPGDVQINNKLLLFRKSLYFFFLTFCSIYFSSSSMYFCSSVLNIALFLTWFSGFLVLLYLYMFH